jgi:hypothetical protein
MERGAGDGSLRLDENGSPIYRFNPLLADLPAHLRMMDKAGIDVAVLSCGSGFDQPSLATCQLIDDQMHQAELDYPGRFIGLVGWAYMDADDLWRMLGWEFSLMVGDGRADQQRSFRRAPLIKGSRLAFRPGKSVAGVG